MDFLPDEVLALVLLFLGVRGRGAAAQTSRLWRAILGDAALFRWTCDECQRTYPRLEPSCEAPWYREWGRLCGQCATRPDVLQALGESFRGLRVYWKCCRHDLVYVPGGPHLFGGCDYPLFGCDGHLYEDPLGVLGPFVVVCPSWEPLAIGQASYEDVARYAQAMTGKPLDANMPRCNSDLITVMKDGRREVVCPISIDTSVLPQCTNCLKTVWQCQRFKGVDDNKYAQCKALEDCMVQNIVFPNGTTQANGVKMPPQCVAAAQVALKQCEPRCASCRTGFC